MTRADVVTAVSEPIADDLRARYGADVHTLTNGYDPEDVPPPREGDPLLAPERFSLVHTGRIAAGQRTPAPLLDAIRLLRDRSPEIAGRIELVLAGPLTADELARIGAPDLRGVVRHAGTLPRRRALELQRAASGLVLLTSGSRRGEVTGKLFEYLAAERPILVLGERVRGGAHRARHGVGPGGPGRRRTGHRHRPRRAGDGGSGAARSVPRSRGPSTPTLG